MVLFIEILLIGVGLSMDAFAVSICKGLGMTKFNKKQAVTIGLQYNNENSLACTINLAFYFAREYYTIIREFPSGKGFADLCFIPRKMHTDKPAAVIELKWDKSAEGAISQIKDRQYVEGLKEFQGNLLLVGVNYDKDTKKHTCMIEEFNVG